MDEKYNIVTMAALSEGRDALPSKHVSIANLAFEFLLEVVAALRFHSVERAGPIDSFKIRKCERQFASVR